MILKLPLAILLLLWILLHSGYRVSAETWLRSADCLAFIITTWHVVTQSLYSKSLKVCKSVEIKK